MLAAVMAVGAVLSLVSAFHANSVIFRLCQFRGDINIHMTALSLKARTLVNKGHDDDDDDDVGGGGGGGGGDGDGDGDGGAAADDDGDVDDDARDDKE